MSLIQYYYYNWEKEYLSTIREFSWSESRYAILTAGIAFKHIPILKTLAEEHQEFALNGQANA